MRLAAAVASVLAVVLALILLVRGRPLVDRRPTDPRMVRALAVCILAISLSTLASYLLGAWGIACRRWLPPLILVGIADSPTG